MRRFACRALPATLLLALALDARPTEGARPTCRARRPTVVSGRIDTRGFVLLVDREVVQSWLPRGLRIDPRCPFDDHPVIILFGTAANQARHKRITYRFPWPPFLEVLVGIPYLRMENNPRVGVVQHYPRVYLNNWSATRQGIRVAGWPKIYTRLEEEGSRYQVYNPCGGHIFTGTTHFDQVRPIAEPGVALPQVREMLSQPLVLERRGRLHVHDFDFHWNCAEVTSVPVDFELREGFMPGLNPLAGSLPGLAGDRLGGFQIKCYYTRTMLY